MFEKYFLTTIGIDPAIYYADTLRNNHKRAQAWENQESEEWKKYRYLAFTIIDSTFAGMNGTKVNKKLKRPEDMFKLPTDVKEKKITLSGDEANEFLKSITK